MKIYDYIVVGAGLFGSAAARYLSEDSSNVCLIGPREPDNWSTHDGNFASHYDESRIVSVSAPAEDLAQLDLESINAYAEIETRSGIRFFTDTGRLTAHPEHADDVYPYLTAEDHFAAYTPYQATAEFKIRFPSAYKLRYEAAPSGYINPRRMVAAQKKISIDQQVTCVEKMVKHIEPGRDKIKVYVGDKSKKETLEARKVLITTGIYADYLDILPKLPVSVTALVVVLFKCSAEFVNAYGSMPPINYQTVKDPTHHISILPPLLYQDGNHYLKCAIGTNTPQTLSCTSTINAWYKRSPQFDGLTLIKEEIGALFPDHPSLISSYWLKPCAICNTPSKKPIIDTLIDGQIYLTTGGSGGAAHTSDAIGKHAARLMINNRWCGSVPHQPFQLQSQHL